MTSLLEASMVLHSLLQHYSHWRNALKNKEKKIRKKNVFFKIHHSLLLWYRIKLCLYSLILSWFIWSELSFYGFVWSLKKIRTEAQDSHSPTEPAGGGCLGTRWPLAMQHCKHSQLLLATCRPEEQQWAQGQAGGSSWSPLQSCSWDGVVCSPRVQWKRAKSWVPAVAGLRGLPLCLARSLPAQCSEQGFVALRGSLRQEKNGGLVTMWVKGPPGRTFCPFSQTWFYHDC